MAERLISSPEQFNPLGEIVDHMAQIAKVVDALPYDPNRAANKWGLSDTAAVLWSKNETGDQISVRIYDEGKWGANEDVEVYCKFDIQVEPVSEAEEYILSEDPGSYNITSFTHRNAQRVHRYFEIALHPGEGTYEPNEPAAFIPLTKEDLEEFEGITSQFATAVEKIR